MLAAHILTAANFGIFNREIGCVLITRSDYTPY